MITRCSNYDTVDDVFPPGSSSNTGSIQALDDEQALRSGGQRRSWFDFSLFSFALSTPLQAPLFTFSLLVQVSIAQHCCSCCCSNSRGVVSISTLRPPVPPPPTFQRIHALVRNMRSSVAFLPDFDFTDDHYYSPTVALAHLYMGWGVGG